MILNSETGNLSTSQLLANIAKPVLKVMGLGGGGCNAVERMIELGMGGVEFIAANTDRQTLQNNPAPTRILLGPQASRGFGAGGDPQLGRAAAIESRTELAAALAGADMVFLTAGMGGGTGTGAIPVVAEVARALGAVTIAIVTTPFAFEMGRRQKNASEGIARLRQYTHTLITIPNDRLLSVAPRNLPMQLAFRLADDVLRQSVQAISELITETGMINVDFAHIRRLMMFGGGALMSIGQGEGENKACRALEQALQHPLLDSIPLEKANGIIINFTGGKDLSLFEVQDALTNLQMRTGFETETVPGVTTDERMESRVQVILIVTGIGATGLEETLSGVQSSRPIAEKVEKAAAYASVSMEEQPLESVTTSSTAGVLSYEVPGFLRYRAQLQTSGGSHYSAAAGISDGKSTSMIGPTGQD
jgi:cell division protein FtsZ